jgi:hypothetical protein
MTEAWWEEMLVQWFDVLGKSLSKVKPTKGQGLTSRLPLDQHDGHAYLPAK